MAASGRPLPFFFLAIRRTLTSVAIDLQVCFPQTIIPLTRVKILQGVALPRSLDITGKDFTSVAQVLINDVPSPSVVVLSKNRLLAQVPLALAMATLTSVTVVSNQLTVSPRSLIKFGIPSVPSKVSGILRLMQVFLKVLLTTPGRDIFAPRVGGNALAPLAMSYSESSAGSIISSIILSVTQTQRQIITIQAKDPTIPPAERLLSASVTNAEFNKAEGALIASISLLSQAGTAAIANLAI